MEIDLEILDMLKVNAAQDRVLVKVGFEYDGSGEAWSWSEILVTLVKLH